MCAWKYNPFTNNLDMVDVYSTIESDTAYYVDGDSGDDSNDGSSWANAKKTLDLLYSKGNGALPRVINADVTINLRGTILSSGTQYHTLIDGFRGTGSLTVEGETTDVQTGIVVTGQDNVASSITYRTYLDASAESWVVDEHKGRFIVITAGTGNGATLYPILSNTATRLETVWLPTTDGTTVVKIVTVTELKGAQVLDPGTLVNYPSTYFKVSDIYIPVNLKKLDTRNVYDKYETVDISRIVGGLMAEAMSCKQYFAVYDSYSNTIMRSYIDLLGYTKLGIFGGKVSLYYTVLDSTDGAGLGIFLSKDSSAYISYNRFYNQSVAISSESNAVASITGWGLFGNCTYGIRMSCSKVMLMSSHYGATYLNFKNTTTAIDLAGSQYLVGELAVMQVTGVTTDIKISDEAGDVATAANMNAEETIQNTATGAVVTYIVGSTQIGIQNPEYNNASSGLAALNFQDAIDELDAIIDDSTIETDVSYYVDGDSGNDTNDGLSWGNAKKTLDFLYSKGIGALPRVINAAVTVNVRGTVLSVGTAYHTRIDSFRGTGTLTLIGETTDEATGIAVTGQDNVASSITCHSYLDASGASWAVNEHQGRFIVITGGLGAGATLYPVMSNTGTRLETYAVPDTDGTTVIKIVSVPKLKGAQVSDPGTIINYSTNLVIGLDNINISTYFKKLDITDVYNSDRINGLNVHKSATFTNIASKLVIKFSESAQMNILNSFVQLDGYNYVFAVKYSMVAVENSVLYSSDGTGWGMYGSAQATLLSQNTRFYNQSVCFSANYSSTITLFGNSFLIENCDYGLLGYQNVLTLFQYDSSGYLNFKNTTTAISLGGSTVNSGDGVTYQGTGVTTEIKVSDVAGDTASFADLNALRTIQNTATGAVVSYTNHSTYIPIQNPEYDNTASGLTAVNFQDAIDELDTAIDDAYTYETITADIDFTASAEEDITISLGKGIREVIRARLYIDTDPGAAFSQYATYTFYSKAAKHGADAFYRTQAKLVYTELSTATTGTDANIIPDDYTDFTPNDLAYFIDGGSSEFSRLKTIAATMVAEDNPTAHAINIGLVRVSEFSGFSLFNTESGTSVYMRVAFAAAQTVSLKLEMLVRK